MCRGFIVVGPESSGTRFMTRLLVEAGCVGSYLHKQPFDTQEFPLAVDVPYVVWRQSFPHGKNIMPDLTEPVGDLHDAGYPVTIIVMVREPFALAHSQHKNFGQVKSPRVAVQRIQDAYEGIVEAIDDCRDYVQDITVHWVPYESLALRKKRWVRLILDWLGAPKSTPGKLVRSRDENVKYYEEAKS